MPTAIPEYVYKRVLGNGDRLMASTGYSKTTRTPLSKAAQTAFRRFANSVPLILSISSSNQQSRLRNRYRPSSSSLGTISATIGLARRAGAEIGLKLGVYHHVTGVDASSSASLAAYINTLTYSTTDKQHKVTSGLYW